MKALRIRLTVPALLCVAMLAQRTASAQPVTPSAPVVFESTTTTADKLIPVVASKAVPVQKRAAALHAVFGARKSLSPTDKAQLWTNARGVAADRTEDPRLRADAIWIIGGVGMMLREKQEKTQQEVSRDCSFLLQTSMDPGESLPVRHVSIAAMGDLKMVEAVPPVTALLADRANHDRPDIARPASIALAKLAPEEAVDPVGAVLSDTTDPAVFGSAAYALGLTGSARALAVLVKNRMRIGDNLPVDNAVEAMKGAVYKSLKDSSGPEIVTAIQATRSLWRKEQKAEYAPLLTRILADRSLSTEVRREALTRLLEDAQALPLDARKQQVSGILPLVQDNGSFAEEVTRMRAVMGAQVLPSTPVDSTDERRANQ